VKHKALEGETMRLCWRQQGFTKFRTLTGKEKRYTDGFNCITQNFGRERKDCNIVHVDVVRE